MLYEVVFGIYGRKEMKKPQIQNRGMVNNLKKWMNQALKESSV